ncbi:polysaccharide deacetylase family protein [Wukongibacter baidiensis]|uniref:polysaccharide deacetylase family protein n=1 Tax=Wukongibacter baidiensis TaxID=1723361 RepID=UPI003D7F8D91
MKNSKWFITLVITLLICGIVISGFNYIIDPFGVFGDRFLKWHSYNMANNPRIAKIAYLDQYHENYNSYVIGGSKSSPISPTLLNKYYKDANFYSMLMYGGDFYDYEKTMYYLIDNYEVKNIVIHMSMHEIGHYNQPDAAINSELSAKVTGDSLSKFYLRFLTLNLKYSFKKIEGLFRRKIDPFQYSQIKAEDGAYDKARSDAEVIGSLEDFLAKYPNFNVDLPKVSGTAIDENVAALKRMKKYCDDRDVSFLFITGATYYKEMEKYKIEDIMDYWKKLADVTDFWDFTGYTYVSYDARNFYDIMHYRTHVGKMMLGRVFDNDSIDIPKGFGHYTTKENVDEYLKTIYPDYSHVVDAINEKISPRKVPIITYHHIDPKADNSNAAIVSPQKFKEDMLSLKQAGFNTIFFKDLVNYNEGLQTLPDKPIVITFDDGYLSNYKYAYPILKDLNMKATISVIGKSVGHPGYEGKDKKIFPHFTWKQAREMYDSGYIDIQSHSFDMHNPSQKKYPFRKGILPKKGEDTNEYIKYFTVDCIKQKELIESNIGNQVIAFSYPYGCYNPLSEKLLTDLGYKVTITVDNGINQITRDRNSILKLKRINIDHTIPSQELLKVLAN